MKNKVLIVGLGQIGFQYDLHLAKDSFTYSHSRAFSKHKDFYLIAAVDINKEQRDEFSKSYGLPAYEDLSEALKIHNPDVVVIATSTQSHAEILSIVLKLSTPKIVLCEKPVTINYKQCKLIVDLYKKKKIHLVVNFHRRWDETTQKISKKIHGNFFGNLQGGYCIYNKGLLNTGSHAIDLLNLFFKKFKIIDVGQKIYDYNKKDPTIPFVANIDGANINFICMKENLVNMMEIKLIFSKKILETNDGGISWHVKANKNKNILNYNKSFYKYNFYKKTYKFAFFNMAKNIYFNLKKGKKLPCDGKNALEVHKQIEKISLNAK